MVLFLKELVQLVRLIAHVTSAAPSLVIICFLCRLSEPGFVAQIRKADGAGLVLASRSSDSITEQFDSSGAIIVPFHCAISQAGCHVSRGRNSPDALDR